MPSTAQPLVDRDTLRQQVRDKYRQVATAPGGPYHFHTGPPLAARLGYDPAVVTSAPKLAVRSLAGVGNPFSLRPLDSHLIDPPTPRRTDPWPEKQS